MARANHWENCDSHPMTVFAPYVNPAPCTKSAEDPLIVAAQVAPFLLVACLIIGAVLLLCVTMPGGR